MLSCTGKSQHMENRTPNAPQGRFLPEESRVLFQKGTERPFSGLYEKLEAEGTYCCKNCGTALYQSSTKFDAGCGWPSFDDEVPGAVRRQTDADGRRTEILCANCDAHLGHVFLGEGFTPKNTRHCVNSVSLDFLPVSLSAIETSETAIFAGGCFWGVEHYFLQAPGVLATEVGYIGGHKASPTYREVCAHTTGHLEATRVVFDTTKTNFEEMAKLFFNIHDPTQTDGQGPDLGDQYLSAIFYLDDEQRVVSERLIGQLRAKGYDVATELRPASTFWRAEDYHQQYYEHKGTQPYCHAFKNKF